MSKNPGETHQKKHIKKRGVSNKELIIPEQDEELGIVINSLGYYRFKIKLCDSEIEHNAKLRGNLIKGPKKQLLRPNDLILLTRDSSFTAEDKYFIIHKYSENDKKALIKGKYLNENTDLQINNNEDNLFEHDDNENIDLDKI